MIYLDYAATTPMSSSAIEAYQQAASRFFGNSNSLHDEGSKADGALESSRKLLASILNVQQSGLHFTASGQRGCFPCPVWSCSGKQGERKTYHHIDGGT